MMVVDTGSSAGLLDLTTFIQQNRSTGWNCNILFSLLIVIFDYLILDAADGMQCFQKRGKNIMETYGIGRKKLRNY